MRKKTIYEKYFKRLFDIMFAFFGILFLSPVLLIVTMLVRIKLGSPVLFKQERPGKDEKIFTMYKFRTMTNKKDKKGNFLPDEERLTRFGKILRSTSLDELPNLFNILTGKMSLIGPRPQIMKNIIFMTEEQRKRHLVRPGLSGLAQVNGRNAISWEERLTYDLKYISKITFWQDLKIFFKTFGKVFKRSGINKEGMATYENLGDSLLKTGKITQEEYDRKIALVENNQERRGWTYLIKVVQAEK